MKRLLSIFVSVVILAIIYSRIDLPALAEVFRGSDPLWMAISLGMVVPLTLATGWRLRQLMPRHQDFPLTEATKLTLSASVLNMVLPSKMGELAKAYFISDRGYLPGSLAFSLVVFEKASDLLSLFVWCVFGLLFYPEKETLFWVMTFFVFLGLFFGLLLLSSESFANLFFRRSKAIASGKLYQKLDKLHRSWTEMHNHFWQDKRQLLIIASISIFIWFLHLMQIWFFIFALRASVPFIANLALAPLAIFAGLLPLTFAGVGTRDAALIFFYQPFFDANVGAALGLLCTSRYLLPAIGGLPFFGQYLANLQTAKSNAK
ncbi:flippase-like domain-containing protein [Phormidium yuhuli AB48]|uniref:Flippase-like domain-containing protein n=1 Tax=Phormidium yuhuli AB48 TaxID=2940671 RepID=A0ABY5ANH0_9CYAN|nr:lysylphosphatidylglycerol synthase transmembrane domain-containing protein [Phormidium yuhuli]USR90355.1 flippase-like domain-containing protein [Phormidium yuhuli AB48]